MGQSRLSTASGHSRPHSSHSVRSTAGRAPRVRTRLRNQESTDTATPMKRIEAGGALLVWVIWVRVRGLAQELALVAAQVRASLILD